MTKTCERNHFVSSLGSFCHLGLCIESASKGNRELICQRGVGFDDFQGQQVGFQAISILTWHRTGKMGLWLLDTANNDEPEGIWVHEQLLEQGVVQPCPADSLARQLVVKPRVEALVEEVSVLI